MALIFKPGVGEVSKTSGIGDYTLEGALPGCVSLASAMNTDDTGYFWITDTAKSEYILGTFTSPETLARTTILSSNNADSAVDWPTSGQRLVRILPKAPDFLWPIAMFLPGLGQSGSDDGVTRVRIVTSHTVNFGADFLGSKAFTRTVATLDTTYDVNTVTDGNVVTNIGSLFFAMGSRIGDLTTIGGLEQTLTAFDAIELLGPTIADAGLRDLCVVFLGTRF